MKPLSILYEDNHLLVVDKPAGIATMGTEPHVPTVARQAGAYLKKRYQKPGNVYVGVVSRLDRPVSGVLVLARTSKAASRLSEQIRRREPTKRYLAYVAGVIPHRTDENGQWQTLEDYVSKNEAQRRMQVVDGTHPGAQLARMRVRVLSCVPQGSVLEVDLLTGRKHQIRLQLAQWGYPIVGDTRYGSKRPFAPGIALHCHCLTITHPTKKEPMCFHAPPHPHWAKVPKALLADLDVDGR